MLAVLLAAQAVDLMAGEHVVYLYPAGSHQEASRNASLEVAQQSSRLRSSDDSERIDAALKLAELRSPLALPALSSALGDPAEARLFRWERGRALATDGPYAEAKEHLAGFFLIDVASRERAEALAARFAGPGETVKLRAVVG